MNATLYQPTQEPKPILRHNLTLPSNGSYAEVTTEAAEFLGCRLEEIDILVTGPNYVVYSIFDSMDKTNIAAMAAIKELTLGVLSFEEDELLRGNILIVHTA